MAEYLLALASPEGVIALFLTLVGVFSITVAGMGGWADRNFGGGTKIFLLCFGALFLLAGFASIVSLEYPTFHTSLVLIQEDLASPKDVTVTPRSEPEQASTPVPQSAGNASYRDKKLLIMIAVFSFLMGVLITAIGFSWKSRPKVAKIIRQPNRVNLSTLPAPTSKDEIYLNILNDEKADILVNQMHIGHLKGLAVDQEPKWSRVYRREGVKIERGESHTARFIVENREAGTFWVVSYANDGDNINQEVYRTGVHKFQARIVYDSIDRKVNGLIRLFDIEVLYKGPSQFEFDIRPVK